MSTPKKYPPELGGQTLISHLIELRTRLIRALIGVLLIFLCLFPFASELYALLAGPLLAEMPEGATMIATSVTTPFLAPFKFALVLSVFIAMPIIMHQIWGFIAPGLYQRERKMLLPLMAATALLFYSGIAFAFFVVFPLVFGFFINVAPEGVAIMTDIGEYLSFVLKLFFAFGLAFEVPVATFVLVWAGVATADGLAAKRPYVIVGSFVMGMLLTPPDIISQSLLAIPIWFLFEVGVLFARLFVPQDAPADQAADETIDEDLTGEDSPEESRAADPDK